MSLTTAYVKRITSRAVIATALVCLATSATAVPPCPDLLKQAETRALNAPETRFPNPDDLHARGIDVPNDFMKDYLANPKRTAGTTGAASGFRVLALLVDFSDNPAQVASEFYDTLMFGTGSGSVADYFDEISFGQITLTTLNLPSTIGWTRAPHPYSYYVNGNYGMGTSPQNSQGLVQDLITAVDGQIDFSQYDNDGDNFVDCLVVIHTGTGAEMSGNLNDIWSHMWSIGPSSKDGIYVSSYTIQPEYWQTPGDMTIGVYTHELCHGFGLPDLYDTDYSSRGIGEWGIMGYGAWNGNLGDSPAHPCAWSRIEMGLTSPVEVSNELTQQSIDAVETGGTIFQMTVPNTNGKEYFLVENRQPVGYDAQLPGFGLLIWHIEENKSSNDQEWHPGKSNSAHYLVALEQADGAYDLERDTNYGDASDPFPGATNNTSFGPATEPWSSSYEHGLTAIVIESISASAATMYADLVPDSTDPVATGDDDPTLPSTFALAQNYPNPFNPGTTIAFSVDAPAAVRLDVLNSLGQHVATLLDEQVDAGTTVKVWDGTNDNGSAVASGMYFYRMTVGDSSQTKKMLLVR
jgi:immune inhibitor A